VPEEDAVGMRLPDAEDVATAQWATMEEEEAAAQQRMRYGDLRWNASR